MPMFFRRGIQTNRLPFLTTDGSITLLLAAILLLISSFSSCCHAQQQQDPMTMNGGSILAMAGKDCVAVAVDKRFGMGNTLVNVAPRPILTTSENTMVAFTGLEGDIQSLKIELAAQVTKKYQRGLGFSLVRRQHTISPLAMASLCSHVLYRRRGSPYYVEPIVVGLEQGANNNNNNRPYLCSMDIIGAKSQSHAFVCAGAAANSLLGTSEALWKPDLEADELVRICAKAFLSALERDCLSGYGALIYLITPQNGILEYDLETRND